MLLAISLAARVTAGESTLNVSYYPGVTIPEGNPVGVLDLERFNLAQSGDKVINLTVNLWLVGGYNGDLFVSLQAPDGTSVVLMNEPGVGVDGFGAAGAGMNITFADDSPNLIQSETSLMPLFGNYQPAELLAEFQGRPADGAWALYCANLGIGDGPTTLVSWGMNITVLTAPEPTTNELGALATLVLIAAKYRLKTSR